MNKVTVRCEVFVTTKRFENMFSKSDTCYFNSSENNQKDNNRKTFRKKVFLVLLAIIDNLRENRTIVNVSEF